MSAAADGVLDAGVVLARLDRRHRSHARIVRLFERCAQGAVCLHVSVVNLAEVLQHAKAYVLATGLDPVTLVEGFKIQIHQPDVEVARRAAALSAIDDASLADRFAVATADALGARLHTTDGALATALAGRHRTVTRY